MMRVALVLFLAILSFGVRPAKAQQLRVTGQLVVFNGSERARHSPTPRSPGGYKVDLYFGTLYKGSGTTNTYGTYDISPPGGFVLDSLTIGTVICVERGKYYAYSPVSFRRNGPVYEADAQLLKVLFTTELKYTFDEAKETIRVLADVEGVLYKTNQITTYQLKITDVIRVLQGTNLGRNPQAKKRAIFDNLDQTLPREMLDIFRQQLAP